MLELLFSHEADLKKLNLNSTSIQDDVFKKITSDSLQELSIANGVNSSLTSAILPAVCKAFPNLEYLDISGIRGAPSGRGIGLTKLQTLLARNCPAFDDRAFW